MNEFQRVFGIMCLMNCARMARFGLPYIPKVDMGT